MSAGPDASPTDERATTIDEGGAVNLDGYDWPALGERPSSPTEAVYEPLKEPKAQHDNDVENATRENLKRLNRAVGDLHDRLGDLEGDVTQLREDHNNLEDDFRKHNHDSRYPRQYDVYYRDEADETFAPREHTHDDRYWRKHLAEDRYLNSTPEGDRGEGRISLPELEMRVGEGFEIIGDSDYWGGNRDARVFRAKDENADGGFLWEFTDLNGENRQEMLAIRAPGEDDSITHGGATVWHADNDGHTSGLDADKLDGTHLQKLYRDLYDVAGDTLEGDLDAGEYGLRRVNVLDLTDAAIESQQNIRIDRSESPFNINDAREGYVLRYGASGQRRWDVDSGRWFFNSGSVYIGNSDEPNDTYDMVWEMSDGTDFRIHAKEDPVGLPYTSGKYATFFTTDGGTAHMGLELTEPKRALFNELRNVNMGGTPLAKGSGDDIRSGSSEGDVYYDTANATAYLKVPSGWDALN